MADRPRTSTIRFLRTAVSPDVQADLALGLPGPRIWRPDDLARFLGVSRSWVYRRTEQNAEDPIPRIRGVGRLRFDTQSGDFQQWMRRQLDSVDTD